VRTYTFNFQLVRNLAGFPNIFTCVYYIAMGVHRQTDKTREGSCPPPSKYLFSIAKANKRGKVRPSQG